MMGTTIRVDGLNLTVQGRQPNKRDREIDYLIGVCVNGELVLHNPYGPAIVTVYGSWTSTERDVVRWLQANIKSKSISSPSFRYIGAIYSLFGTHLDPDVYSLIMSMKYTDPTLKTVSKVMNWDEKTERAIRASILLRR